MNNRHTTSRRRRRQEPAQVPYRRVQHALPLGSTPAVQTILAAEGLTELVAPELREVYYHYVDIHQRRRDFCAVGWRNENGGWEVRAPGFCGYIGRKGMTFINGSSLELLIFPDMGAYLCWRYRQQEPRPSILILNHAEFSAAAGKRALRFPRVTVYREDGPVQLMRHGVAA